MADTQGFQFVEDHDDNTFFIILPNGDETDPSDNDEIAICDDGMTTYLATNCVDFPGMHPGVIYGLGAAVPTTVIDVEELPDEDGDDADTDDTDDDDADDLAIEEAEETEEEK
jgi:hypothetical protein